MKIIIGTEDRAAEAKLAADFTDNSGIGTHYTDEYLKQLNLKTDDHEVKAKRKGLKVMLKIDGKLGTGLMRRLDVSKDPIVMLQQALKDAATEAGYSFVNDNGELSIIK